MWVEDDQGTSPDKVVMKNKIHPLRGSWIDMPASMLQRPSISQSRAARRAYVGDCSVHSHSFQALLQ